VKESVLLLTTSLYNLQCIRLPYTLVQSGPRETGGFLFFSIDRIFRLCLQSEAHKGIPWSTQVTSDGL